MISFIDKLVDEILQKHNNDLSEICVVFPTRRACIIFKNRLIAKLKGASWLPATYSISDFVAFVSPYRIVPRPQLLLKLFPVYKKYYTGTSYNSFVGWGEMMLKDFDEIDRYLISKDVLFAGVKNLKEIDAEFQFTEEEESFYSEFWKNFSNKELSASKEVFLKTWKTLPEIYDQFQLSLVSSEINYEGFVYRLIAGDPGKYFSHLRYKNYFFAGFYALSASEEEIIKYFMDEHNAEMFWDADEYYLNNSRQEAGKFIRESRLAVQPLKWPGRYFEETNKKIEVIGVRGNSLIAKQAGVILENLLEDNLVTEDEAALILPDESMLMPVLNSLPGNIHNLNVTMGFSMKDHFFFSFFSVLKKLSDSKKVRNEKISVLTDHVKELVSHSIFKKGAFNIAILIQRELEKVRSTYLNIDTVNDIVKGSSLEDEETSFFNLVFKMPSGKEAIINYMNDILSFLAKREDGAGKVFGNENLVQHLHHSYGEFIAEINEDLDQFDDSSLWHIIGDFFEKFKFPFSGEPVNGLQLMGFLETRVLDFRTLIITNVNEGVLPSDSIKSSFIPFSIRRAFKLPTYTHQDAIFSYHFFRLLQRAEQVYLLYNTEVNALSGGEASRFILQIIYEIQQRFSKNIEVRFKLISEGIHIYNDKLINIVRSAGLTNRMLDLFSFKEGDTQPARKFTPSSINTYVYCPFKFYLHYVEGLREEESIEESMQASEFGNVLHKALEVIYSSYVGSQISGQEIGELFKVSEQRIMDAIKTEYDRFYVSEGENYLFEKVLVELIKKTLHQDIAYAPFKLLSLENEYRQKVRVTEQLAVSLAGKFDRVDEKDGTVRVIDYKTGKADVAGGALHENLFTDPKFKINLQLLVYNQLARDHFQGMKIICGISTMRQSSGMVRYLAGGSALTPAVEEEFLLRLKEFFRHVIFDSGFKQTTDLKKCETCGFKRLCNR